MSDIVVVSTFLQRHEAEMAKGLLESEGIKSTLSADDCGGMRPGMSFGSGIILMKYPLKRGFDRNNQC